jgi:hypothetical protein
MVPWCALVLCAAAPAAAQGLPGAPPGAVPVAGFAALVGGSPAEEDEASPITLGQLGLEADLLLIRRHGPGWEQVETDAAVRGQARRIACLLRLLARQARQMGETVVEGEREEAQAWLEERAGGADRLRAALERRGLGAADLTAWLDDALLAGAQLRYLAERSGGWSLWEEGRREERAARAGEALAEWLHVVLERAVLRLLP